MNNRHWVVFGAMEKPNKALIGFKSRRTSGMEVHIVEIDGDYDFGEDIEFENVTKEYTTLYFAKKKSLQAFIRALEDMLSKWE